MRSMQKLFILECDMCHKVHKEEMVGGVISQPIGWYFIESHDYCECCLKDYIREQMEVLPSFYL